MIDRLATLLGPHPCVACGRRGSVLCPPCEAAIPAPAVDDPIPGVAAVIAPWSYVGSARHVVLALKLRAVRAAAEPASRAMARGVQRAGLAGRGLTWVPGRRADVRARGFDHVELLARSLGARLGVPVHGLLTTAADRADQTELGAAARRANLAGAFAARACAGELVVVDDVVTTGATARACAAALRRAGATRVEVVAAARV